MCVKCAHSQLNKEKTMKRNWMTTAEGYLGTHETPGASHTPLIVRMWERIRAPFRDDETPWCAAFVGSVLEESGFKSTRSGLARSYLKWGIALPKPAVGAVAILWRGKPNSSSGHVGFVVGFDTYGNVLVLGGNQGNAVTVAPYSRMRVLGYRWPEIPRYDMPTEPEYMLPTIKARGLK